MRNDGRRPDALRPLTIEPDYLENPHGSALITQGKTIVLCTAMIQEEVPRWLRNQGRGWMTAEYSLLPASTGDRVEREASRGKQQGRTVEIKVAAGETARLEVCDTGIGFTRAQATRVFERFYRTEDAVERQVPGTGLGLFIAHAITDAHGGTISAHPRDGGGAVFRVELPLAQ